MPTKWPKEVRFKEVILCVQEKTCRQCGSHLVICSHREHCIYTFDGALKLICKQAHCSNKACASRSRLINPEAELTITMPRWRIDWKLFTWMGFRRLKRHWSIPQIQHELCDTYHIRLSDDAIREYVSKYQVMVAARHQDIERWREEYKECVGVILAIDGIQPEKGHETLYVIREVQRKRVWFAEPLLSSSYGEIRKVIQRAKNVAQHLNKPIRGWISDKQEAFVTMIAEECPNVPHRYCQNHFLRDLAKLVLEKDSHAKVHMRRKVRGLRTMEKETLAELDQEPHDSEGFTPEQQQYAADIVLDYCAAIRGILNDNHGGPLRPPGLRMAEALEAVSLSLERNLKARPTPITSRLKRLQRCIQRGVAVYQQEKSDIVTYVTQIQQVVETLNAENGPRNTRLSQFRTLTQQFAHTNDTVTEQRSKIMTSFESGLFVGNDDVEIPDDNLELERWFKKPKGHERRIHGRKHVGMRIVNEGPTLLPALDAHLDRNTPFTYQDLLPYVAAKPPKSQRWSVKHKQVMTKARSKKNDLIC
jgi:hypothetical protein